MLFRYFARQILAASAFVLLGLLVFFGLFDVMHEVGELGKNSYGLATMATYVALTMPSNGYLVMPMAALIGTLFTLARMSEQSELTVLRASGLSLARLAVYVAATGLVIGLAMLVVGEVVSPWSEEAAKDLRLKATHSIVAREFRSGFWVKDDHSFVNIQDVTPETDLLNLRIYEFDPSYRLTAISRARKGVYDGPNRWALSDVELTRFEGETAVLQKLARATWTSVLTPDILAVLKIVPERMSVMSLHSYIEHLRENRQKATRYEIAFYKKLLYPLAGMLLMVLTIPFALVSSRAGGAGVRLILGILIGLLFYAAGQLTSHLGLLNDWPALVAAGLPVVVVAAVAFFLLRRAELR